MTCGKALMRAWRTDPLFVALMALGSIVAIWMIIGAVASMTDGDPAPQPQTDVYGLGAN